MGGMANIYSIVRIRNVIILSAVIFITICVYIACLQYSSPYNIRIISTDVEPWEGWSIKYTLEELRTDYPEFLPFVNTYDSDLHTEHRRKGKGDTIFWDNGDGAYPFVEIYSKKLASNYLRDFICYNREAMPQAYLRTDRQGYLKPTRNIREGIYYITQLLPSHQLSPYGFFIEIQKAGWRIAGWPMSKRVIIPLNESGTSRGEDIRCDPHVSPLLEFNIQYKMQGKLPCHKDFIIVIGKE